jgi:hypothetical protein
VDVRVDDEVHLLLRDLVEVDGHDGLERGRLGQITLRGVPVISGLNVRKILVKSAFFYILVTSEAFEVLVTSSLLSE